MSGQDLRACLAALTRRLRDGGVPGAERDARFLLAEAAGIAPDRLTLALDEPATEAVQTRAGAFADRRLSGWPVSRLLGRRLFWGRVFEVTGDVLDPRPETEVLIDKALARPFARCLDLGTGSGVIAVTLLAERGGTMGTACDISAAALRVAARNAAAHGVENRLTLVEGDWFSAIPGSFDLIVSNPPYIAEGEMAGLAREVRDHDPRAALTDGGDGLQAYRTIAAGALAHMAPGGRLLVEIGPAQGAAVRALFSAAGLADVAVHADLDGRDRVVEGRRPRP